MRKKSLQVAKSLFVLKLVNPLFFEANDRIEKKNRLIQLQMDFSAPFCFQVTKLRKEDKNGFFFCIKKEHFSMYLYVKQCAIENEVNSRSRCCMFANNSKLHMHYLTLEPNSLKNRIFGIYIYFFIIF